MLLSSIDPKATSQPFLEYMQLHQYLILFGTHDLYVLFVRYRRGLRQIPGPWFASVSSIW